MLKFFRTLLNSENFKVLLIVIVLDTVFGILRAIREKRVNSCIGIDGIIRKTGMIISIIFLKLIDVIVRLDLIGFLPENLKTILNIEKLGIGSLFSIMFIIFETLSVFKNMVICKLPIPRKLQMYLEKIMKEFTDEIK